MKPDFPLSLTIFPVEVTEVFYFNDFPADVEMVHLNVRYDLSSLEVSVAFGLHKVFSYC